MAFFSSKEVISSVIALLKTLEILLLYLFGWAVNVRRNIFDRAGIPHAILWTPRGAAGRICGGESQILKVSSTLSETLKDGLQLGIRSFSLRDFFLFPSPEKFGISDSGFGNPESFDCL
ncbi:hypothetical protein AYI68_g2579 [Smittium mucronatum]|uniref:Uncharacterized protein n=1 Tax=Smittium mucronatum TaxID=133383 RepID=A0A1R0H2E6_9FUNG|nr:hypothetical protein AYI68_g2579 [Smittium mucronatum]